MTPERWQQIERLFMRRCSALAPNDWRSSMRPAEATLHSEQKWSRCSRPAPRPCPSFVEGFHVNATLSPATHFEVSTTFLIAKHPLLHQQPDHRNQQGGEHVGER
jgi:hypothetical protein